MNTATATAHEFNLDAAQRELDRRAAEGEDVSHLRVNPATAAIEPVAAPVTRSYTFISDAGHGWIEVPFADVRALKVAGVISQYSYMDRNRELAYLEEDCDANAFMQAAKAAGWDVKLTYLNINGDAFIRRLPRFQA